MATFKARDGKEYNTTAKLFVKSYYRDAECGRRTKSSGSPRRGLSPSRPRGRSKPSSKGFGLEHNGCMGARWKHHPKRGQRYPPRKNPRNSAQIRARLTERSRSRSARKLTPLFPLRRAWPAAGPLRRLGLSFGRATAARASPLGRGIGRPLRPDVTEPIRCAARALPETCQPRHLRRDRRRSRTGRHFPGRLGGDFRSTSGRYFSAYSTNSHSSANSRW